MKEFIEIGEEDYQYFSVKFEKNLNRPSKVGLHFLLWNNTSIKTGTTPTEKTNETSET